MEKKYGIVLLATDKCTENGLHKVLENNTLELSNRGLLGNKIFEVGVEHSPYDGILEPQHMYITVNDEIIVGDYSIVFGKIDRVITANKDATSVVFEKHGLMFDRKSFPKVIQTTDKELSLQPISSNFIQNFVNDPNDEVLHKEYSVNIYKTKSIC